MSKKSRKQQQPNPSSVQTKSGNILTRFFSHNITLLILSFILAFTIWFIINASSQTNSSVTISDIPVVDGDLSEEAQNDGLEIFRYDEDTKVSVEVSGNRITVGSLTASDIKVSYDASNIITTGNYFRSLEASKTGGKNNYEIVSIVNSPSVEFYVDKRKDAEFPIENRLVVLPEDNKHKAFTTLSRNSVKVTGPATYVKQIDTVVVFDSIKAGTDETKIVQEKLKFLDADGKELDLKLVKPEFDTVDVTINVWPTMTVKLAVDTVGAPEKNCPAIQLSPSVVKIAAPQSVLDQIVNGTVSIDTLDFSKLKNEKVKNEIPIELPEGCKLTSGESTATLSVDLSSYQKGTYSSKITADTDTIDAAKYSFSFSETIATITLYGPESVINSIDSSKITVKADFTGLLSGITADNPAGQLTVPLTVTLPSEYAECWVYGSYTVSANVSMK